MQDKTQEEQIRDIVDELIGPRNALRSPTILGGLFGGLDVSRPNIHDNKKEFLREKNAVASIVDHLSGILDEALSAKDDTEHHEMRDRLRAAIDDGATRSMRSRPIETASDLALLNIGQAGFFYSSLFVIIEMKSVYRERLTELNDQEKQFWTTPNRPPNHYARTIALRLARLYAREKGQQPTFGIARDGGHPSTDFGRALEEIYLVLGIKARVRNAAQWAIKQLTDEDLNPSQNGLLGEFLGRDQSKYVKSTENALGAIAKALEKGK